MRSCGIADTVPGELCRRLAASGAAPCRWSGDCRPQTLRPSALRSVRTGRTPSIRRSRIRSARLLGRCVRCSATIRRSLACSALTSTFGVVATRATSRTRSWSSLAQSFACVSIPVLPICHNSATRRAISSSGSVVTGSRAGSMRPRVCAQARRCALRRTAVAMPGAARTGAASHRERR